MTLIFVATLAVTFSGCGAGSKTTQDKQTRSDFSTSAHRFEFEVCGTVFVEDAESSDYRLNSGSGIYFLQADNDEVAAVLNTLQPGVEESGCAYSNHQPQPVDGGFLLTTEEVSL